ncbi:MAG: AI-2E family transporter [Acidimicrobiales bacterium]
MASSSHSEASSSDTMPSWVPRAIALFLGGLILLYYGRGVLESLRSFFIILLVAAFLSFAIEPAVNRMERMGVRRGAGTAVMFLLIIAGITGFGFAIGTVLAEQISEFVDTAPATIDSVEEWLQDNVSDDITLEKARDQFLDGGDLGGRLTDAAGDVASFGTTILNTLLQVFTIALFTFYSVAEGPRFRKVVCSVLAPRRQRVVLEIWDLAIQKTGGYILSRAILALAATLVHWAAFTLFDVPFPLPMALWVGVVSQFIPVVGTYLAGALPVILALIDDTQTGIWALVVIIVYQQLENYVFAPRVTAQTMEIHVAVAFGSVLIGAAILGPVGALLSLPFAATVQAFVSTYIERHELVAEVDGG